MLLEAARPDPSIGNVIAQTINRVSGFFGSSNVFRIYRRKTIKIS